MCTFVFIISEVLPLVEFFLDSDIADVEATSLLELEPVKKEKEKWRETRQSGGSRL